MIDSTILLITLVVLAAHAIMRSLALHKVQRDLRALTAELERLKQQDENRWARLNRSRSQ